MISNHPQRFAIWVGVGLLACSPLHDLDAVTRGGGGESSAGVESTLAGTTNGGGGAGSPEVAAGSPGTSSGGANVAVAGSGVIMSGSSAGGEAPESGEGGMPPGSVGGTPGGVPSGGDGSGGSTGRGDAPALPIDLANSPVTGTLTVATDATWEVNGVFVPTFEIRTPSASYWLVKSLGMVVSIVDSSAKDSRQWIAYSTGFRPLRGFPSYGSLGTPEAMTTTLDQESQTPTHLRLNSHSTQWRLVWDFYPTHVTLTVNGAPPTFGMAYRGVPGDSLENGDRFVPGDGPAQSASVSFVTDLPGPAEWAYISDTAGRSLFMIQHSDDSKPDRFQIKDNDSALLSFGDGALQALPQRFSLGIVNSTDHQTVKARVSFVRDAIH